MDDGLVLMHFINEANSDIAVLILVVVDDGLVQFLVIKNYKVMNPVS